MLVLVTVSWLHTLSVDLASCSGISSWVTNLLEEGEDVGFGDCVLAAHTQGGPGVLLSDE